MRTSLRPNRLLAFGLVDSLVGLLLLAVAAVLLASGYSNLMTLGTRQENKARLELENADRKAYEDIL